jgi:hypothetical protein
MCNPSLYTYVLMGVLGGPIGALNLAGWPKEDLIPLAYLVARLITVAFGVGAVYLLYLIGSRYVGPFAGYAAATFLALNFLHGRDSHFATNDIPAVTLGLIAFYLILRWLEGSDRAAAPTGLALGLAVAMKYNLAVLALPLGYAVIVRRLAGLKPWVAIRAAAVTSGAAIAGFLLGTPYALIDSARFLRDLKAKAAVGTVPEFGQTSKPAALFYMEALEQGSGVLLLLLMGIGAFMVFRHHRRLGVLITLLVIPYLYMMFHYKITVVRFALFLLPFICLLAALAVHEVHQFSKAYPSVRFVAAILVIVCVLEPAGRLIWHDMVLSREDTRVEAKRWIEATLPQGSHIGVEDYGPPLGSHYNVVHEWALPVRSLESWRAAGVKYLIASSFMGSRTGPRPDKPLGKAESQGCGSYPPDGFSPALYKSLLINAHEVATFSPWKGNRSLPFSLDDVYSPFWEVFLWYRPGPEIMILEVASKDHEQRMFNFQIG